MAETSGDSTNKSFIKPAAKARAQKVWDRLVAAKPDTTEHEKASNAFDKFTKNPNNFTW